MHRIWAGLLAVTLALLAAGCGGDDSPATGATSKPSTLTATQLATQAEAICARFVERYAAIEAPFANADAPRAQRVAYARGVRDGTTVRLETADELAALVPPAALREDYQAFVASLRAIAAGFPTYDEAVAGKDPRPGPRDAARLESTELAADLEIRTACG